MQRLSSELTHIIEHINDPEKREPKKVKSSDVRLSDLKAPLLEDQEEVHIQELEEKINELELEIIKRQADVKKQLDKMVKDLKSVNVAHDAAELKAGLERENHIPLLEKRKKQIEDMKEALENELFCLHKLPQGQRDKIKKFYDVMQVILSPHRNSVRYANFYIKNGLDFCEAAQDAMLVLTKIREEDKTKKLPWVETLRQDPQIDLLVRTVAETFIQRMNAFDEALNQILAEASKDKRDPVCFHVNQMKSFANLVKRTAKETLLPADKRNELIAARNAEIKKRNEEEAKKIAEEKAKAWERQVESYKQQAQEYKARTGKEAPAMPTMWQTYAPTKVEKRVQKLEEEFQKRELEERETGTRPSQARKK